VAESGESEAYTEFPDEVGGSLRICTPLTLNLVLLLLLRASVWAFTLKESEDSISVECLFSLTLRRGALRLRL
jgi:hypothetical protein